jgi:hypothetical protein
MLREFQFRSTESGIPATHSLEKAGRNLVLYHAKINRSGSEFLPEKRYAIL